MKITWVRVEPVHNNEDGTLILRCAVATPNNTVTGDVLVEDDIIPITVGIKMTLTDLHDELRLKEEGNTNESV